ncbi:hypothetical protein C8R46DRAFT_1308877 [Mycena filopes]|nr:hypothetical protein C8R46DRAFT_1308877 [Mycena filopes]
MPTSDLNTLQYTVVAVKALQDLFKTFEVPFLGSVCSLSLGIITLVQMFHSCLTAQQDLGKLKRLLKRNEIAVQLDKCERDLQHACDWFTAKTGVEISSGVSELSIDMERRHQELLELMSGWSESLDESSVRTSLLNTSSGSLSLLPGSPKIFHGREPELNEVITMLETEAPRVAILGPGGMGKTTLATAVLHYPTVIDKYRTRHFLACESANTSVDLVASLAAQLELPNSRQLSKDILRYFSKCGPCLLILDNFETPWESSESRGAVEEFLSALADIQSLALLITMRGAERPGKVKWTRPFLPPLEPLSLAASRQIFIELADEPVVGEEPALVQLLDLSGSLPLAVSLMANIVSFEGYHGTLTRWQLENTTLLSDGHNKYSNLEKSIILSLSSPRMLASPASKDLLSLLSILPDGITDQEILTSNVPIPQIGHCRSSLLRTSLAYVDITGRLKSLSPIREYIQRAHPPSLALCRPLRTYFESLLSIWRVHREELSSGNLVLRLTNSLGNITGLFLHGLAKDPSSSVMIGNSILTLNHLSIIMLKGVTPLMRKLPESWLLRGSAPVSVTDAERWITEGLEYFSTVQRPVEEAVTFYEAAALYYHARTPQKAVNLSKLALSLKKRTKDVGGILRSLILRCRIIATLGDSRGVIEVAREGRAMGGLSYAIEVEFLGFEADANCSLGNFTRSLALCAQCKEKILAMGFADSDRFLGLSFIEADIRTLKGEYAEGLAGFQEVVTKTSPTRCPRLHANSLICVAYCLILIGGKESEILANFEAGKALYTALGIHRILSCNWCQAELDLYRGNRETARSGFIECLTQSRALHQQDIVDQCLASLGDPRHGMDTPANTLRWAVIYLASARRHKNLAASFHAIRCLADLNVVFGDEDAALTLFRVALEGATEIDVHPLRARSMVGIAEILARHGELTNAKELLEAAHPLFMRSLQTREASAVDTRLKELTSRAAEPALDHDAKLKQLEGLWVPNESPKGVEVEDRGKMIGLSTQAD